MGRQLIAGVQPDPPIKLPNVTVTGNVNADTNKAYWVDTTSAAITLTLPANATTGDVVRIYDISNTFDSNNLTISRNGNPIMGATEDLTVSTEGAAFELVFYDAVKGWRLFTI